MHVKICGLSEPSSLKAACDAGAGYLGFNFFARSPRYVSLTQASGLALQTPAGYCKVALVVDADNSFLDQITNDVPVDMLQLHGQETPARVAEVRNRYGLPVMKAIGIRNSQDLGQINAYAQVSDQILCDAKPPKNATLPGGNGLAFDWTLLAGRRWSVPWMLAGGLNAVNVVQAMQLSGAQQVDVSSGVESAPGVKDNTMIAEFMRAAKGE